MLRIKKPIFNRLPFIALQIAGFRLTTVQYYFVFKTFQSNNIHVESKVSILNRRRYIFLKTSSIAYFNSLMIQCHKGQ